MKISRMSFDGAILARGYWIYAIMICHKSGKHLYIGRTGDNSSKNAGSPFQRITNHLNLLPSAPKNTIKRFIKQKDYRPADCQFRLLAVGPLFREQKDYKSHKPIRNKMTALEKSVADYFDSNGYDVIGKHADNDAKDPNLAKKVIKTLEVEIKKEMRQLAF